MEGVCSIIGLVIQLAYYTLPLPFLRSIETTMIADDSAFSLRFSVTVKLILLLLLVTLASETSGQGQVMMHQFIDQMHEVTSDAADAFKILTDVAAETTELIVKARFAQMNQVFRQRMRNNVNRDTSFGSMAQVQQQFSGEK